MCTKERQSNTVYSESEAGGLSYFARCGLDSEWTAEMVTVITLDGEIVDGDLAPTSEVPLHTGIYAATNALAITHAHAMASTALSCTHDELPALHYSCLGLGGSPRTAGPRDREKGRES